MLVCAFGGWWTKLQVRRAMYLYICLEVAGLDEFYRFFFVQYQT